MKIIIGFIMGILLTLALLIDCLTKGVSWEKLKKLWHILKEAQ